MKKKMIEELLALEEVSVKESMRLLDRNSKRLLFVVDNNGKLVGSLTDGDIRRWVLSDGGLDARTADICNRDPVTVLVGYDVENVRMLMQNRGVEGIPVTDCDGKIVDILFREQISGDAQTKKALSLPVVIMAGGKGSRLDPFTRILPKPLIPIGEKAIIEVIMDKFALYGIEEFFVSVNHKSKMIKAYFEEMNRDYTIHYLDEDRPLGTAGGLRSLKGRMKGPIFVTNCDIIIDCDYAEINEFHCRKDNKITVVGAFRHFTIPYGICELEDGGTLKSMKEKPEYDCLVNTGMYIVEDEVLDMIPENSYFDITDLIAAVRNRDDRVGVFPVSEKSWIDIGQWEEYHKSLSAMGVSHD